ncbi:PRKR-interacting protein 1, partial [Lecanoromycetidae sp. Uapishka_2]
MSEPIPESIPTSQDPRSKRPLKKRALTPNTQQASQVDALFAKPDRDIVIPDGTLTKKQHLSAPPEIVANVQGSSAGAGSGEFHVYKASRRREYERIKMMDEEVAREIADEEFEKKREEMKRKDEEKTGKNRKRREKLKNKKKLDGKTEGQGVSTKEQEDTFGVSGALPKHEVDGQGLPATTTEDVGVIIHDDD